MRNCVSELFNSDLAAEEETHKFIREKVRALGFAKPGILQPNGKKTKPFYVLKPKGEETDQRVMVDYDKIERALELNPDWEVA